MPPKVVIGLTGNIASGKSTVAGWLAQLGAQVVDADHLVHEVEGPGTPETAAVLARFGPEVRAADGSVDRAALGRIVFADPAALADLEAIVRPAVQQRLVAMVEASEVNVFVIEALKLLEGPLADRVDRVWVVTAPREVADARLRREQGLSPEQARQRLDAQGPEDAKIARADLVLVNDGSLSYLQNQVASAWDDLRHSAPVGTQ